MDTVRCTVTCGHHWAGRQSELCQDFTPTEPAWRRRTGRGRAEEGDAWVPRPTPGGTGQRARPQGSAGLTAATWAGHPGARRQGPGVHRSPAMGCFPPGHGSGPQASLSQAVGQKPWTSACWAPRGQSQRPALPPGQVRVRCCAGVGARPTADIWAGRWGGRAGVNPGVGVESRGAVSAACRRGLGPPLGSGPWNVIRPSDAPAQPCLYSSTVRVSGRAPGQAPSLGFSACEPPTVSNRGSAGLCVTTV